MEEIFEVERKKYRPKDIKFLLIAEAPPKIGSGRFFYFLDVKEQDSLFLEIMKVLYPSYFKMNNIPQIRSKKCALLNRFMEDGFYLIDAVDQPMLNSNDSYKKSRIRDSLACLKERIDSIISKNTSIILISKNVYDECAEELNSSGYHIKNTEMIDFPGSGRQKMFRYKFDSLLKRLGYQEK